MPINSINQDQIYGWVYAEFFTLHYKDGSDWVNIPGIESLSQSGAEAPMRDVVSVNGAATQNMGISRTGSLTFNAKIMPNDKAWRALRDAQYNRTLMHFRIDTDATLLFESDTTNGATFATGQDSAPDDQVKFAQGASDGQDPPTIIGTGYGRGAMIKSGTNYYFIDNITNDATPVVTVVQYSDTAAPAAPSGAVSPAAFKLYGQIPMRQTFSALVPSATNMELSAESEMMTTLTLALRSKLSHPTLIKV